jgi:hypothetical protein
MNVWKLFGTSALVVAPFLGCGASSDQASSSTGDGGSTVDAASAMAIALSDPETDFTQTKTITMDSFVVPAGGEVYMCQTFANPWGNQVDIKTYSLQMSPGSHHMFAFYASNATDGALEPCPNGGLQFGAFTFTAQQPQLTETFPATVGATIPATTGFQMMAHYLNATATDIVMTSVALTIYVATPGVVTQHAGVMYLNNEAVMAPPGISTSTDSFTLPQDIQLMSSASHMHHGGTNFVATASSGQTLYQTTEWAEPPGKPYSPPLSLTTGTKITWTCTYDNTTGTLLSFGESALKNVMCISVSVFYPVSDINNPVLGSSIAGSIQ